MKKKKKKKKSLHINRIAGSVYKYIVMHRKEDIWLESILKGLCGYFFFFFLLLSSSLFLYSFEFSYLRKALVDCFCIII